MYKITCSEEKFLISTAFQFDFEFIYQGFNQLTQQQLEQDIFDQDVLIINDLQVTEVVYQHNPHLKLIALCSTGYEHIDLSLAHQYGVKVCNVRDYATESVAEHTFMLMLALGKNLANYQKSTRDGRWQRSQSFCYLEPQFPIKQFHNKTLVILGRGAIGEAVATKAHAFNMQVIYAERPHATICREGYLPFQQAIQQADILSLHCPLTEETRGCIHTDVFAQMKPNSLLINVSRGGLIDHTDLYQALHNKTIAGYASDTGHQEPIRLNDQLLDADLNTVFTPHIAWASEEAQWDLFHSLQQNIESNLKGQERCLVGI
jgi:glycerate dehydrogenase